MYHHNTKYLITIKENKIYYILINRIKIKIYIISLTDKNQRLRTA